MKQVFLLLISLMALNARAEDCVDFSGTYHSKQRDYSKFMIIKQSYCLDLEVVTKWNSLDSEPVSTINYLGYGYGNPKAESASQREGSSANPTYHGSITYILYKNAFSDNALYLSDNGLDYRLRINRFEKDEFGNIDQKYYSLKEGKLTLYYQEKWLKL